MSLFDLMRVTYKHNIVRDRCVVFLQILEYISTDMGFHFYVNFSIENKQFSYNIQKMESEQYFASCLFPCSCFVLQLVLPLIIANTAPIECTT